MEVKKVKLEDCRSLRCLSDRITDGLLDHLQPDLYKAVTDTVLEIVKDPFRDFKNKDMDDPLFKITMVLEHGDKIYTIRMDSSVRHGLVCNAYWADMGHPEKIED